VRACLVSGPTEFLDRAGRLLLADEARHNLILGIAASIRDDPSLYPEHRLWVVEEGTDVVGAAFRTPPRNLVLARHSGEAALAALADALTDALPGVVGARPEVDVFSTLWAARTGSRPRVAMEQGIYALDVVREVMPPAGRPRAATLADRPLLRTWWRAFTIEAEHHAGPDPDEIERAVDHRLGNDACGFLLWEDGDVVSLAGYGSPTPNGIRIGPVYTPPELRGRGYATALVAAVSAGQIALGRRFCFLYTDLANATSNAIYRRIGYEQVCESAELAFDP